MVLHRVAAGKEDDNLLFYVFFEERKKEEEPSVGRAHNVTLGERRDCAGTLLVIDVDVQWPWAK
jgi:hypothetical protein